MSEPHAALEVVENYRVWDKFPGSFYEEKRLVGNYFEDINNRPFISGFRQSDTLSSVTITRHFDRQGHSLAVTLEIPSVPGDMSPMTRLLQDLDVPITSSGEEVQPFMPSVVFLEPFVDLFHKKDQIAAFRRQNAGSWASVGVSAQAEHVDRFAPYKLACADFLHHFLTVTFADIASQYDKYRLTNAPEEIAYHDLWMIYPSGSVVYFMEEGMPPCALMVASVSYKKLEVNHETIAAPVRPDLVEVELWNVDFHKPNGRYTGKLERRYFSIVLDHFEGTTPIRGLKLVPDAFMDDVPLKRHLVHRGGIFWALRKPGHWQANRMVHTEGVRGQSPYGATERIMVDPEMEHGNDPGDHEGLHKIITGLHPEHQTSTSERFIMNRLYEPSETDLMLCPPTIRGFSLNDNRWSKSSK